MTSTRPSPLLARVYFLALLPFLGSALAPWIAGPAATLDLRIFMLWSYTVMTIFLTFIFTAAVYGQRQKASGRGHGWVVLHGAIGGLLVAAGLTSVVMHMLGGSAFASVALMTVLQWGSWLWGKRSRSISTDYVAGHNRFVWAMLACHMFVLLNEIYRLQQVA